MEHLMILQFGLLEMVDHFVIFKMKIPQMLEMRMFHHLELLLLYQVNKENKILELKIIIMY